MDFKIPEIQKEVEADFLPLTLEYNWGIVPSQQLHSDGDGVFVAVLDNGIDFRHVDYRDRIVVNKDFTRTGIEPTHFHGSHVGGTIASQNQKIGLAPASNILNLRVLGDNGGMEAWIVEAMEYCIAYKKNMNIKHFIVNRSLGAQGKMNALARIDKKAIAAGIIICDAAGNDFHDIDYPAANGQTISVAAHDENGEIASFSSRGKENTIAAPGVDIWSNGMRGRMVLSSGTSMATPFITGTIAKYLSRTTEPLSRLPVNLPTLTGFALGSQF